MLFTYPGVKEQYFYRAELTEPLVAGPLVAPPTTQEPTTVQLIVFELVAEPLLLAEPLFS